MSQSFRSLDLSFSLLQKRYAKRLIDILLRNHLFGNLSIMSTVQEILTEMDKLTPDELRVLKLGVDSRLADDDDDPALQAALHEAIAYANAHPEESKSIDEVRALIPKWISARRAAARNER